MKVMIGLDAATGRAISRDLGVPEGQATAAVEREMNPVIEEVIQQFCPGAR